MANKAEKAKEATADDLQLPLVIRCGRLLPYLLLPIIIGWVNVLAVHDAIRDRSWSEGFWHLSLTLSVTLFMPVMSYRYQVRVDEEFLWYRTFLRFKRIRLADIERIDDDPTGVQWFWDHTYYIFSWYVHPVPMSGAKGFRLNFHFMSHDDLARFYQLMQRYFPDSKKPKRGKFGRAKA